MAEKIVNVAQKYLDLADIKIGGNREWDLKVNNDNFYKRVLQQGSMGLGESYMDGWWDSEKLDVFFYHLLSAELDRKVKGDWRTLLWAVGAIILNKQNKSKAFEVGEQHYDIGNDLYDLMLDKRKVYTCGYWKDAKNLDEAQEAKLHLVCKKLDLKPGQRILDIGCGWGSFAKFAAENYGVSVVGVTVSKEQVDLANKLCAGLPVEIRLQDYREIDGMFDHIVSLGMFEHVGYKNYRTYMKVAHDHLKDGGLFLLHTIGGNFSSKTGDKWTDKYIFPNGMLPSVKQIGSSIEGLFILEDLHNFGADYDKTLMAWFENFDKSWDKLKSKYGDRFYRMWKYYLLCFAGSFRSRKNQLWQIVLSKKGVDGGYSSIR